MDGFKPLRWWPVSNERASINRYTGQNIFSAFKNLCLIAGIYGLLVGTVYCKMSYDAAVEARASLQLQKDAEVLSRLEPDIFLPDYDLQSLTVSQMEVLAALDQSEANAHEIMGKNFIGTTTTQQYLGVRFSEADLTSLSTIPWSDETLKECKDTHILFPYYPLSIIKLRARAPKGAFYDWGWYNDEPFAHEPVAGYCVRWVLLRKTAVPDSVSKTYEDQCRLLTANDYVPEAREVVYGMDLCCQARGDKLFGDAWIRTATLTSSGDRVGVRFYGGRLFINGWGGDAYDVIGLASSRKVPK